MHPLPLVVLVMILGTLAPPALGQEPKGVASEDTTRAGPAKAPADDDMSPDRGSKSGFGQVMALLTGLLEDAAQREASGNKEGFALDHPAVVVSVTPVRGADSFLRRNGSPRDNNPRDDRQRDASRRNAASARLAAQPRPASDTTPH